MTKNLNFCFYYTILSVADFLHYMTSYTFAHYVILMMAMSAKTETTGAVVEKEKISANHDNFITKIFLAIKLRK